ncbi:MAG: autotransporter-associated beta strand repeat-containing protein [Luteolibacter sp.]|uniref:endo-beta-N-acetylglucosaminidase n=1 Tax=Luteolibacter sp. TaxID=1962973 RepID=UPI003267CF7C
MNPFVAIGGLLIFRRCLGLLAGGIFVFLSIGHAAAEAKTYRYFRFVPTKQRDNPSAATSLQISEFQFIRYGSPISTAGVTVTNTGGNNPVGEGPANLLDSSTATKWLDFNKRTVTFAFPAPVTIDGYNFATANDAQERDPSNWRFEGSADNVQWVLLDLINSYSATTARTTYQTIFSLPKTVAPYSSFWHPEYLLNWTPASDPNADFNRSNVPLATRFAPGNTATALNAAFNINAHARPGEAKIATLTGFSTSGTVSQATAVEHSNAMSYWQYTEDCVYFGGSASEGLILAPSAPVIDAGHRNGVPVYGNVFFPPTGFGGRFQWVNDFLKQTGATYPVADKLIEVANYYGFDGWFINQETTGGSAATATAMKAFIAYLHSQAPNLKVMWYDAMNESGSVGWQDQFNSQNDSFMKDGANAISNSMFIDFGWSSTGMTNSRTTAQTLGVNPYALYAGVEFDMNSFNQPFDWTTLFPEGSAHKLSVGFYGLDRNFKNAGNPTDFHANENRFWSGPNGDPSNTTTADTWKGMAHYVPASSPLTTLPFVTNFNLGHGHLYAINGQVRSTSEWSNLSTQDVLPTWRWLVQGTGANKLVPSLDRGAAYYGGTSLLISGTLDGTDDIRLFQSSLTVAADTNLRLVFNRGTTGASAMKIGLAFEDSPTVFEYLDVGTAATSSWNTKTFALGAYVGRKIAQISLQFTSAGTISGYTMRVGQMAIYNGAIVTPSAPSSLTVTQQDSIDADTLSLRLKWNHSATPVYYYNIYSRAANNSLVWLGATPNNVFQVPGTRRLDNQAMIAIEVEAVGRDFGTSTRATANAAFPPFPNTGYPLTGTVIGSTGAWNNGPDTRDKVFDGNTATAFDALNATGDWAGLDLTTARTIAAIRFYPRTNYTGRMPGGVFQGSNTADFSGSPVTLATVTITPPTGIYTTLAVDQPTAFRYVRYLGAANSHCNVAEVQFYEAGPAINLWTGAADSNWNNTTNWSLGRVPVNPSVAGSDNAVVNSLTNFPVITASLTATPGDIIIGSGATARVDHRAGSAASSAANGILVGRAGGNGTYNLANTAISGGALTGYGTGSGSATAGTRLAIGTDAGSAGAFRMNTSGTLAVTDLLSVGDGAIGSFRLDSGNVNVGGEIRVGQAAGSTGSFSMSGGNVTNNNAVTIGSQGGNGTLTVNGGSFTKNGTGNFVIGNNAVGSLTQTAGAVTVNGQLWIGQDVGATNDIYTLSGGTVAVNDWIAIGRFGGTGTLNMTGGTVTKTGAGNLTIGASATGAVSVSGGLIDVQAGNIYVGELGAGPASLTLSGSGEIRTPQLLVGLADTTVGTVNLNGGTLKTALIDGGAATANVYFNGTQIIATANASPFISDLDIATIQVGGLRVNSAGFSLTIPQPLGGGGGIVKSGLGTLTLAGSVSFTGDTQVLDGTLVLNSPSLDNNSGVSIATGATLNLPHGQPDTISRLFLDGSQVLRGTYVAVGSATPGIQTPRLTGTGSLVVLSDAYPTAFDSWASTLPPGKQGRQDDADGDGFTNLQEYLFGTLPQSANPALVEFTRSPSEWIMTWKELKSGGTYQLQESVLLTETPWPASPIVPTLPSQARVPANYTLKQAAIPIGQGRKFFRVRGAEN